VLYFFTTLLQYVNELFAAIRNLKKISGRLTGNLKIIAASSKRCLLKPRFMLITIPDPRTFAEINNAIPIPKL
jgi:hypothetical protein